ncbi:MAG: helix-turn-helix domain-containing protein [Burkholderiaceae bacterium]|jgi:transcriptional regulator GlxA family with amidase domain|nr:helix-turn-helix domain-containing protein [Burkholderiaceae bacterium]
MDAYLVAVPETAGSALYGMVDVLAATGSIWQALVRSGPGERKFNPVIVSERRSPFLCGNGIPVQPGACIEDIPAAPVVIVPEIWIGPDEDLHGRYPRLIAWLSAMHGAGAHLYSACSGAVLLAETGLLDGRPATSHWGYQDLFRRRYPRVQFQPEPNLCFADISGRIVTAGGTTSWHDLALHVIARHCSPGEALRIAKVYLLKWHDEGQLPYASLVRPQLHTDAAVRRCENWLQEHFRDADAIARVVTYSGVPERSLKRRFKASTTGLSLIDYLQNLRVEAAKRMLEAGNLPVEEISARVGYEEPAFFRRLFRRRTGLPPAQYRRTFQPFAAAGRVGASDGATVGADADA